MEQGAEQGCVGLRAAAGKCCCLRGVPHEGHGVLLKKLPSCEGTMSLSVSQAALCKAVCLPPNRSRCRGAAVSSFEW